MEEGKQMRFGYYLNGICHKTFDGYYNKCCEECHLYFKSWIIFFAVQQVLIWIFVTQKVSGKSFYVLSIVQLELFTLWAR